MLNFQMKKVFFSWLQLALVLGTFYLYNFACYINFKMVVSGDRNPGAAYDQTWFMDYRVNTSAVNRRAADLAAKRSVKKQWQAAWLLKAVTCIDLTTLSGDDTFSNVQRLCHKAVFPVRQDLTDALGFGKENLTVGAVCVYPNRVPDCVAALGKVVGGSRIAVASVATGFPSGQTPLETRLKEIEWAVKNGATEIDVVINRDMALRADWKGVYDEVCQMRKACGLASLKTILAVGELGSLCNVYRASMVCMMAGSDFIKTSTGKEATVNATFPVGLIMCRAIRDYHQRTGFKIGFKAAGGVRSAKDACQWLILVKEELGDEWLYPHMFRIGASALLIDIERQLFHYVYGRYAAAHEFPIA